MIVVKSSGDFKNTEAFLNSMKKNDRFKILSKYGEIGVNALSNATPVDTGLAASSWYYELFEEEASYSIVWSNSNVENGLVVAVLLQYGHATKSGTWVQGYDYINPTIQPLFDQIAEAVWREVKNA